MKQAKQFMQQLLLVLVGLVSTISVKAADYDFKAANSDGVTIYYKICGEEATVVSGDEKYTSDISIPNQISYNGKDYIVTAIGKRAFAYSKMDKISLPEGIKSIGEAAFIHCWRLKNISFPFTLKKIENFAFEDTRITSLYIPDSLTEIGNWAFAHCYELISIKVAEQNQVYDSHNECNAIIETSSKTLLSGCKTTIIPDDIEIIAKGAFEGMRYRGNIPDNVKYIKGSAFRGYGSMIYNIPSEIIEIEDFAFWDCTVNEINIPATTKIIGKKAFLNSLNVKTITVHKDNPTYDSRNGCNAIIETNTDALILGCKYTKIPENVKRIESGAFKYAFQTRDPSIDSITLPKGINYIGNDAFYGCPFKSVRCFIESPFPIDDSVFNHELETLYVPKGSIEKYKSTQGWTHFKQVKEL